MEPQGHILLLHRKERPLYSLLRGHLTLGIYSKAGPRDTTYFKVVKEFLVHEWGSHLIRHLCE